MSAALRQDLDDARKGLAEWRAIALAAQADAQPVAPEGWKLVPVEPTKEMEAAYHQGFLSELHKPERRRTMTAERAGWLAMLAAAPAAAPPARQPQWMPIETAPKDGSMFVCWVAAERWSSPDGEGSGSGHDVSQVDLCWWRPPFDGVPESDYFDNASGQVGDSQAVTHWMPLPPPPGGIGREGE